MEPSLQRVRGCGVCVGGGRAGVAVQPGSSLEAQDVSWLPPPSLLTNVSRERIWSAGFPLLPLQCVLNESDRKLSLFI